MSETDPLAKKQSHVLETICSLDIQDVISQPCNNGVCFSFPISDLIKKNNDCKAEIYAYGTRADKFQDWHA